MGSYFGVYVREGDPTPRPHPLRRWTDTRAYHRQRAGQLVLFAILPALVIGMGLGAWIGPALLYR